MKFQFTEFEPALLFIQMKKIPLKSKKYPNRFALVDDCDYDLVSTIEWRVAVEKGRCVYAIFRPTGKLPIKMHRLIMGVVDSNTLVDHRNGNGLDNRRRNLRTATQNQNKTNRRKRTGSMSKHIGVSSRGSKWYAFCNKDGIKYSIGPYESEFIAAVMRDKLARRIQGEFASLNFPKIDAAKYLKTK